MPKNCLKKKKAKISRIRHHKPRLSSRSYFSKEIFGFTAEARRFFLDDTYTYYLVPERLWPVHTQEVVVIELKMVVSG